jgi:phosphate transport system permease protein
VIPVVVRTTDDMLKLVPNSLREAAGGARRPTWKIITLVSYRAARAGIVTGSCSPSRASPARPPRSSSPR